MWNMLEAINKLKLKNSKNHFSILVLYLPAYSCRDVVPKKLDWWSYQMVENVLR